jgi:hypothetical protein
MIRPRGLVLFSSLFLLVSSCATWHPVAVGDVPPACASVDGVDVAQVTERLAFLEAHLQEARSETRLWFGVWLALMGGATVGQTGLSFVLTDPGLRVDARVSATGTLLAILPLLFTPRRALSAFDTLEGDAPPGELPAARLCRAEQAMAEAAHDATAGASWVAHVVGDAAAAAVGTFQWRAFGHGRSGLFTAFGGSIGNEALVLTQPTGVVTAWRDYQRRWTVAAAVDVPTPVFAAGPQGVSLRFSF